MSITLKVVLLGESGVGKTSIINQFTSGIFIQETVASISAQFITKEMYFKDLNQTIKFEIWDTAGQEKYRSIAKIFYKNAKIIFLCYDITNYDSFIELKNYWYEQQIKIHADSNAILAIVANKNDLYEKQKVQDEEGISFAKEIDAIFQSTSAKSDSGISTLFNNVGLKYLKTNFDFYKVEDEKKSEYEQKKNEIEQKKQDSIPGNRGINLKKHGTKKGKNNKNDKDKKKQFC